MHNQWTIGLTASALLLAGSAFAQQPSPKSQVPGRHVANAHLSQSDQMFMKKAAQDNLAEVQTAKWVEQKTNNPAVRKYAQDLRTDHANAQEQLKQVAQQAGVALPSSPTHTDIARLDQLKKLSGKQLDRAFVKNELKDHKEGIQSFDTEIATSHDPAVKDFAEMVLPHLQDHMRVGQDLAGNLDMPGRAGLNKPAEAVNAQALTHSTQDMSARNRAPRQ
jgi:putative membrane protein